MDAPREVIDLFVYELYDLTDHKIHIVQEATSGV